MRILQEIVRVITDPRLFNNVMIWLSFASSVRWLIAGNGPQALYWGLAGMITYTVTYLLRG